MSERVTYELLEFQPPSSCNGIRGFHQVNSISTICESSGRYGPSEFRFRVFCHPRGMVFSTLLDSSKKLTKNISRALRHTTSQIMLNRKRQRCVKVGSRPSWPTTFPLFLELPPEIRNMIYTLALGDRRVHFMYWEEELHHVVCQDPTSSECGCVGVGELLKLFSSEGFSSLMKEKAKNLTMRPRLAIALLQTCRQIHDEAIYILFETNIWDVCNRASFTCYNWPSILFRFTDIVQPKLLERIVRLEFRWIFKELPGKSDMMRQNRITRSARTWSAHWERINRKFVMLRELVVRIKVTDPFYWEVGVRMYWAAPMRINHSANLRSCKVFLERNDKTWVLKELGEFICSKPGDSDLCIQQELVPVTPEQLPISYSILALG